jgi:hypothetical protein
MDKKALYALAERLNWVCYNCQGYAGKGAEAVIIANELWCPACFKKNPYIALNAKPEIVQR